LEIHHVLEIHWKFTRVFFKLSPGIEKSPAFHLGDQPGGFQNRIKFSLAVMVGM
jgi:hypothetical protein